VLGKINHMAKKKQKGKKKVKQRGPTATSDFRAPNQFKQKAGKSMQKHTIRRGRAG